MAGAHSYIHRSRTSRRHHYRSVVSEHTARRLSSIHTVPARGFLTIVSETEITLKVVQLMKAARHWFWIAPIVLGLVFVVGGGYMIREGRAAHDEIRDTLLIEDVTTSEDASIPNVKVDSAATAKSEAEVIVAHVNKITGGKTYAQMERDDPNRPTVLNSITLRTSLNMAVMGFNVSDLVVGLGLFMIVIGATHILFLAPAVYWAAEVAKEHETRPVSKTATETGGQT